MKVRAITAIVSLLVLGACPLLAQQRPKNNPQPLPPLETVSQTNQKIRLLASASTNMAQAPEEDALEPGDLISVDVFDIPELSRKIRIDPAGYISIPLIPQRIHAADLTSFQLEKEIAGLLKARGLVSHPQVTVFVIDRAGLPITVIGAVEHPMVYHAVGATTLLEVLSAAGGLKSTAGNFVTISHTSASGKTTSRRIDLQALIDRGDPRANILLQGGDVVAVPKAGIVYVVGAVNRPGGFVIQNDTNQMTALKALALAGGIKSAAKPQDAVIIRKDGRNSHTREITINIKKILDRKKGDVTLQANDVLFIPNSPGKKFLAKAAQAALSITTGIVVLRGSSGGF